MQVTAGVNHVLRNWQKQRNDVKFIQMLLKKLKIEIIDERSILQKMKIEFYQRLLIIKEKMKNEEMAKKEFEERVRETKKKAIMENIEKEHNETQVILSEI